MIKIMVTLDSMLDTRRILLGEVKEDYTYRVIDDLNMRSKYLDRDSSILKIKGLKPTNIHKLLIHIKAQHEAYCIVSGTSPDAVVVINTYPYMLSDKDMNTLHKIYSKDYTFANEVKVINEKPTLTSYKSYDSIIDYDGLRSIETILKDIDEEVLDHTTLMGLEKVTLYIPALVYDLHYLKEVMKQVDDLQIFFEQLMKEYTPVINLEVVDVNFFNNTKGLEKQT